MSSQNVIVVIGIIFLTIGILTLVVRNRIEIHPQVPDVPTAMGIAFTLLGLFLAVAGTFNWKLT